jgi:hypothetical protein
MTGQQGQDILDRTAMTGQPGEDSLTDKPGQVNLDRNERTGWPEHDRKNRSAWTGHLGQDSHKRAVVTGLSVQVSLKVNIHR